MQSLDRRKALTTMGLAGAVALVTPAAAIPKLTATDDQHLLDLWQRFVAAEVAHSKASVRQSPASTKSANTVLVSKPPVRRATTFDMRLLQPRQRVRLPWRSSWLCGDGAPTKWILRLPRRLTILGTLSKPLPWRASTSTRLNRVALIRLPKRARRYGTTRGA
jgi:hypothetical protein